MTREELIESLTQSRDAVLEQFDTPVSGLGKAYAPGKWTVRQLLVHLTDCEIVYLWRACRGLAEPGSHVHGFDQDAWAKELNYSSRPLPLCRDLFLAARNQLIYLLEAHEDGALERTFHHSEAGILTLRKGLTGFAGHTEHHLEQIRAAIEGQTWVPMK
ncbi:MAG: DinB family protein [Candidatus Hydrogenedentes bacterium]|nr:DinB family protein [Candidatus Hydrogenedentota bacterium]